LNEEIEEHAERDSGAVHETRRWGLVVALIILIVGGAVVAVLVGLPLLQGKSLRLLKYKEEAAAFAAEKQFGKAVTMYQKALALRPNDLDIRKSIAQSRLLGGDLPEATSEYHRCLRAKPDDIQTELTLASLYLLAKNLDRSAEIAESILQRDPDNVLALVIKAQCHYERSDTSHPMVTVKMIAGILPTTSSRYDLLTPSEIVSADANYENKLLEAVKASPNEVQPHKNLADYYRRQKRFAEAEKEYQKMVELAPEDPYVHLHLADFYALDQVGRLQDSIGQYAQVLEGISAKNLFALRGIAGLSLAAGVAASATENEAKNSLQEAAKYVERILWEQPSDTFGHYFGGILDLFNKQPARAEESFRFVAKENPTIASAHFLLGYTLLLGRDINEAKKSLEEAAKVDLTFSRPRLLLAEIALALGEPDKALQIIDNLLLDDRQKSNPLAYVMRGRIRISQNDYTQAEGPFTKLAELDQQSVYPGLLLGAVYKRTDKKDQAVKQYEQAIAADPSSAIASYLLGLYYEKGGEPVQSWAKYEQAIKKDPNFAPAARSLAEVYVKTLRENGDANVPREAIVAMVTQELTKTLDNSFPNNFMVHFALLDAVGQIFYRDRQFDKAVGIYELIPPQERDARPKILYHYGMALYGSRRDLEARGKPEEAEKARRRNVEALRELEKYDRWMRDLPKAEEIEEVLDDIKRTSGISG
jgi:tetratricopeptide (TPR) repeat protein